MADMGYNFIETPGAPIKAWTRGVQVEDKAEAQLRNVASLPFIFKHVAAMPDVHWGLGATVGSVIPTKGAIIPAAVGVDIGCGMMAVRTDLRAEHLPDNLAGLRSRIEEAVPHGRTDNGGANDRGAWGEPPGSVKCFWSVSVSDEYGTSLEKRLYAITERHPKLAKAARRAPRHLGTLGTGNHFIEICLDEDDHVWAMLHSGSRGIGNAIGRHFIELAKRDMRRWHINLPDADLAYLPEGTEHFDEYVAAVSWAQDFARTNREIMMDSVLGALRTAVLPVDEFGERRVLVRKLAVDCHHNYVAKENHFGSNVWVTRKGAVRARDGDLGIIPGSMGARSYIVRGKGNPESFHSCAHGAGRAMSRGEARRRFTVEDHIAATRGVECRKDADVIDETPGAYKPIDAVMDAQADLVEVVHELRQVVCVKG